MMSEETVLKLECVFVGQMVRFSKLLVLVFLCVCVLLSSESAACPEDVSSMSSW